MAFCLDMPSQMSDAFDFDLATVNSDSDIGIKEEPTSVLKGSSLTHTHVRAGFGSGMISRTETVRLVSALECSCA